MVQLNLAKDVVLNLVKKKGLKEFKARVVFAIDYSGSMGGLYFNGLVQRILERIVPVAMALDSDSELEVYLFDDVARKLKVPATEHNCKDYIKEQILSKKWDMGGTRYAPIMNEIAGGGKLQRMFGDVFGSAKKDELPTYVIFITDGDCTDHEKSEELMKELSNRPIFWQFVGLGGGYGFSFLEKLDKMEGRVVDNANFFSITPKDLSTWSDEDLYNKLIFEFPTWITEAKTKGILK